MAKLVAQRATCARRAVGCVLVNGHGHVIATGYNGTARGQTHCIDQNCPGAGEPSGQGLHLCEAIHAEQNALLQCRNILEIHTAYVTASPCLSCVRLLLNTSCQRIVFAEEYPHPASREIWHKDGRQWVHHAQSTESPINLVRASVGPSNSSCGGQCTGSPALQTNELP